MAQQPQRPVVAINCPVTGRPLSTGISMPPESFATSQLINNTVGPCPHCGQAHTWSKLDAFVAYVG